MSAVVQARRYFFILLHALKAFFGRLRESKMSQVDPDAEPATAFHSSEATGSHLSSEAAKKFLDKRDATNARCAGPALVIYLPRLTRAPPPLPQRTCAEQWARRLPAAVDSRWYGRRPHRRWHGLQGRPAMVLLHQGRRCAGDASVLGLLQLLPAVQFGRQHHAESMPEE